jgi:hypothetical protein
MIKKYYQFINEADETPSDDPADKVPATEANEKEGDKSDTKFTELKDEIKSMIEKTIENSGGEFNQFIDSYKKSPEDVKIEGLINDSEIYEFYLKWRNDIDELLNDRNFFDEVPTEINAFGLYEYVIKGTERAITECVKSMK